MFVPAVLVLLGLNLPFWLSRDWRRHGVTPGGRPFDDQATIHTLLRADPSKLVVLAGNSYLGTAARVSDLERHWKGHAVARCTEAATSAFAIARHFDDHGFAPKLLVLEINARDLRNARPDARLARRFPVQDLADRPWRARIEDRLRSLTTRLIPRLGERSATAHEFLAGFGDGAQMLRVLRGNEMRLTRLEDLRVEPQVIGNNYGIRRYFFTVVDGYTETEQVSYEIDRADTLDRFTAEFHEVMPASEADCSPALDEHFATIARLRERGTRIVFLRLPKEARILRDEDERLPRLIRRARELAARDPGVSYLDYTSLWAEIGSECYDGGHWTSRGRGRISERLAEDLSPLLEAD